MDLTQKNKLDTVTLLELMGNDFYIPDYQRGYRWTETEVKKLMEDLDEYVRKFDDDDYEQTYKDFYCMQPLVVFFNKEYNRWEVIDGQQRLTTTYLILNQDRENLQKENLELFSLDYQSRPGSKEYLKDIDEKKKNENIDYYHIYNANETIGKYFAENGLSASTFIREILNVNKRRRKPTIKFIWYDVTEEIESKQISPEEKFSNLNIGKIGLTNAELIKSLFLHHVGDDESEALRIATEWDVIEHALQDSNFWQFIYGKEDEKYATRIEFLFDIIRKKHSGNQDAYYTFNQYTDIIKARRTQKEKPQLVVKQLWKEVSDKYHLFKGWYEDKNLYHIIGYLRYKKKPLADIESLYYDPANKDMPAVYAALKAVALAGLENPEITKLDYNENASKIFDTLLLFNILSIIDCEKESVRFSFSDFYSHSWDIEHVRSQAEKGFKDAERIDWLSCNLEYFSGVDYNAKEIDSEGIIAYKYHDDIPRYKRDILASAYLGDSINGHTAGELCQKLLDLWKTGEEIVGSDIYRILKDEVFRQDDSFSYTHNIGNLVLLDQGTNRGYKNAFFPVKRKWIYRRENEGIYILPCTRNVFAKNYSTMIFDQMNWNEHDAQAYMNEIERMLADGYDGNK